MIAHKLSDIKGVYIIFFWYHELKLWIEGSLANFSKKVKISDFQTLKKSI